MQLLNNIISTLKLLLIPSSNLVYAEWILKSVGATNMVME